MLALPEVVHAKPVWQALSWQQRWPGPPHVEHTGGVAPLQAPASQAPPRQHASPSPPHARQVPVTHAPSVHRLFAQHCWLSAPQGPHWFVAVQVRPTSQVEPVGRHVLFAGSRTSQQPLLHWSFAQHGWLAPPQPAHALVARQRSPPRQTAPAARQRLARSQQPPAQTLPAQQGVPGVPQAVQVRPEQTVCAWLQNWFWQHCWPPWPQATQVLLPKEQTAPVAVHWFEGQHGWPRPPHAPQEPLVHTWLLPHMLPLATQTWLYAQPPPLQRFPGQAGSPGPPHTRHTAPWQMVPAPH